MAARKKKAKDESAEPAPHRAGFAAIVGRPNVGKSTLLNRLLGQKLAIVSPKPQTTRARLLGVLTRPTLQLALLDTPGIHKAKGPLNRFMVEQALSTISDVDVVLYVVEPGLVRDASSPSGFTVEPGEGEQAIIEELRRSGKPCVLAINKIDSLAKKELILPLVDGWRRVLPFAAIVPLSALQGDGLDPLVDVLAGLVPEGPRLFPEETVTDVSERQLAAEFIREQVVIQTRQELPYATAVVVEEFDESDREERNLVRIGARIYVERDSQKAIVIGKKGELLKNIGTQSRRTIQRLLGCRVWLGLEVIVEPRWTERTEALHRMGYA